MAETKTGTRIRRVRQGALAMLAYGGLVLLAVSGSRMFGEGSVPWIANGALLGWVLSRRSADAWAWFALCLLGDAGARLLLGADPVAAAANGFADIAELVVAWTLLRRTTASSGMEGALPRALAAVLLAAPLAGASLAAFAMQVMAPAPWTSVFVTWWLAHAVGLLAITPVVLAATLPRPSIDGAGATVLSLSIVALLACIIALAWSPFALAGIALVLLLAACRLRVFDIAVLGLVAVAGVLAMDAWHSLTPAGVTTAGMLMAWAPPALQIALVTALAALGPMLLSLLRTQRDIAVQGAGAALHDFRMIAENAPSLVAGFGPDSRHRFANRSYLQWHGLREEEVIGRGSADLYPPPLAPRLATRVARVLAGQSQQFDLAMPDGRELRARYEPKFGADGAVDGFYLLAEDVSWRGQSERRFESLLAVADPLLVIDASAKVMQANVAAAELFDIAREDLLHKRMGDLLAEGSRGIFADAMRALPQSQQMAAVALAGRGGDREIPMDLRLGALAESGGLAAVRLRDLAEQRRLASALDYEASLSRVMLTQIADAVVACDREGRIVLLNQMAEKITGWSRDEALGQPLARILQAAGQESDAAVSTPLQLALVENRDIGLLSDVTLLRREGGRLPIEATAAPVQDAAGEAIGAVMVFHDVSETRATAMKMSHLAQHDYLTDLPNRVLLHDRLSQALAQSERGSKGALLFVDLDFFKHINDTLGHQAGDKVLQEVARRLVDAVRVDDTVSRQGGDEFVLLLVRLADPRDAARVAEKLILAIEEPFHVEGQELRISASVGIALFPQDARDSKTLMKQADTALYHAKEAGRGRYSYFTGSMSEQADQRMRTEHDLRFALANEDFFLVYQPKVLLPEGRVTGMEALVRWRRCDTLAIVPPDEFIPVAEETGLIVALDEWVLREACRQNRAWQDAGLPPVPVSVNVSLARFDPERLIAHVRSTLSATGMAPQWLEIEFTETQMFTHHERSQLLIAQLKELGVQIAVDDFGTGYSSLGYLMRYKFDALKIDRSFVRGLPDDPKHAAIVQAIVGMARALDYRVIAEGVEDFAQAEALQRLGCAEMQGYLYSRPVPAEEFATLLRQRFLGSGAISRRA